jgi:hypothetical protein
VERVIIANVDPKKPRQLKKTNELVMSDSEQTRRMLAISAYNNASDILDRSELSEEDAYRALCEALASRALWEPIGNATNLLIDSLHEGYSRALLNADDERYGDVYMVTVQLIAGISDLEDRSIIESQFADLPMP